jgi:hypothetical protein
MPPINTLIKSATDRPVISTIAASAVLVTSILGGAKALDIRLIPWATASELKAVEEKSLDRHEALLEELKTMRTNERAMRKQNRVLLKSFWEGKVQEAEEELAQNPRSRTAAAQAKEAKDSLDAIAREEAADVTNR